MKTIQTRYGMLAIPEINEDLILRFLEEYGEWSWNEIVFIASFLPINARVLDIGAFIGTFGIGLQLQGQVESVCFVEANPSVIPFLSANTSKLCAASKYVVEAVVTGEGQLRRDGTACSGNLGSTSFAPNASGDLTVTAPTAVSLRNLRDLYGPFDLIKIDAEGLERDILSSDEEYLSSSDVIIWAECNDNEDSMDLIDYMLSLGRPTYYFAYPAFNPCNYHNNLNIILPIAYEAGLMVISSDEIVLPRELWTRNCLIQRITSKNSLKAAMWRTPRWGLPEWENTDWLTLAAITGRQLLGQNFDDYLTPAASPPEFLSYKIDHLLVVLETLRYELSSARSEVAKVTENLLVLQQQKVELDKSIENSNNQITALLHEIEEQNAQLNLDQLKEVQLRQMLHSEIEKTNIISSDLDLIRSEHAKQLKRHYGMLRQTKKLENELTASEIARLRLLSEKAELRQVEDLPENFDR